MAEKKTNGKTEAGETGGARNFAVTLTQIRDGDVNQELSNELHDLIRKCRMHSDRFGKGRGELHLKLVIEVEQDSDAVAIRTDVTSKAPKAKSPAGVLWLTDDDTLDAKPKQVSLPLREVPLAPATKDVGPEKRDAKNV